MMDDLSGHTVKGYDIGESIGTGSFGVVYRAVQPSVGREVAIKIILPAFANQPDFVRRFETEARLIARLEHPHIVPLFDYWREPDIAYLVMRLLSSNLRAQLDQHGPSDDIETVEMVDQVVSALAMSHRQGVVHRDIKPDNILLDGDCNAYLSDFGLAEVIKGSLDRAEEGITGSPAYMAPEQLKGAAITLQSDVYALGIVIYEMLTGKHPYGLASISDLIRKHLLVPLPSVREHRPELPESVDYVLQRATAKDPDQRY
ncbi:MAG: serine/threonine protein kinase, partial [Anaerolineae bacterium]|nr:serine/threonine protein kinase [Anaerolineae bacterium]